MVAVAMLHLCLDQLHRPPVAVEPVQAHTVTLIPQAGLVATQVTAVRARSAAASHLRLEAAAPIQQAPAA